MTTAVQRIRDFMTPSPITISPDLLIPDAIERMYGNSIRHLPVVDRGHLVGVLSDRDAALIDTLLERDRDRITVGQAMKRNPFTCQADDRVVDVVSVMIRRKLGSAIVLDGPSTVVGIFTTIDAMARLIDLCSLVELMGRFEVKADDLQSAS